MTDAQDRTGTDRQLPIEARIVGWLLAVGGVLFIVVGTIGVFDEVRTEALIAAVMIAYGALCLVVGRGMLRHDRRAYVAAAVLLALSVLLGIGRAVVEGDRSLVSQSFVPAVALWAILRPEPRAHYTTPARPAE